MKKITKLKIMMNEAQDSGDLDKQELIQNTIDIIKEKTEEAKDEI